jgi:AraC-like DNA-binding protein
MAARLGTAVTLRDLAREVGCSPYYLCRVFRRATGRTIHGYREQLRLRTALAALADGADLTTLALDLGYSSHSHFTASFRKAFGTPPSRVRGSLTSRASPDQSRP